MVAAQVGLSLCGVVFVAGCLGVGPAGPKDRLGPIVVGDAFECDARVIENCDQVASDAEATVRLRPMRLAAANDTSSGEAVGRQANPETGVTLRDLRRSVLARDLEIDGFAVGVSIENAACKSCRIVFENLTINGGASKIQTSKGVLGFPTRGVLVRNSSAEVVIRNATIAMPGGGLFQVEQKGGGTFELSLGESQAIEGIGVTGNLSVEGVRMSAAVPTRGPAVEWREHLACSAEPGSAVALGDLAIEGFVNGVSSCARSLTLGSVNVICSSLKPQGNYSEELRFGVAVSATLANVDGKDVSISNCAKTGLELRGGERVSLSRLGVTGASSGISLQVYCLGPLPNPAPCFKADDFRLSNFTLAGNGYGLNLHGDFNYGTAVIRDGLVSENRFVGMHMNWLNAELANLTFDRNGHSWPDPAGRGYQRADTYFGGLVMRAEHDGVAIRSSRFEGNVPFAISARLLGPLVDARENWWGDWLGPRLRIGGLPEGPLPVPPVGGGNGDAVDPGVLFVPFSSAP